MAKKRLPISGLQTAFRDKDGNLVNYPKKRPSMTNYTPGEKAPKPRNKVTEFLTGTVGPGFKYTPGGMLKKSKPKGK